MWGSLQPLLSNFNNPHTWRRGAFKTKVRIPIANLRAAGCSRPLAPTETLSASSQGRPRLVVLNLTSVSAVLGSQALPFMSILVSTAEWCWTVHPEFLTGEMRIAFPLLGSLLPRVCWSADLNSAATRGACLIERDLHAGCILLYLSEVHCQGSSEASLSHPHSSTAPRWHLLP